LRREWNTKWDKPTTGPENGGQLEDVEEEHDDLSDGGSLFQRYQYQRLGLLEQYG